MLEQANVSASNFAATVRNIAFDIVPDNNKGSTGGRIINVKKHWAGTTVLLATTCTAEKQVAIRKSISLTKNKQIKPLELRRDALRNSNLKL